MKLPGLAGPEPLADGIGDQQRRGDARNLVAEAVSGDRPKELVAGLRFGPVGLREGAQRPRERARTARRGASRDRTPRARGSRAGWRRSPAADPSRPTRSPGLRGPGPLPWSAGPGVARRRSTSRRGGGAPTRSRRSLPALPRHRRAAPSPRSWSIRAATSRCPPLRFAGRSRAPRRRRRRRRGACQHGFESESEVVIAEAAADRCDRRRRHVSLSFWSSCGDVSSSLSGGRARVLSSGTRQFDPMPY